MMKHRNTTPALFRWMPIVTLACFFSYPLPADSVTTGNAAHQNHTKTVDACRTPECLQQQRLSQKALDDARKEGRPYSRIYVRDDWPHWSDTDNDCQDTRAEILIARSTKKVRHNHDNECYKVLTGEWYDPYTNRTFTSADKIDIDHIIALAEAHRYGGADWPIARKKTFANDPENLIPVQREANHAKGSLPANQWMPKNLAYWCDYIRSRETVVQKYGLQFPEKERIFNARIKESHCP